jgi:uncharacterized protein YejL (UPF0352 family)
MTKHQPHAIAEALADALPADADTRSELVAVGMVASALIATSAPDGRAELVETFCKTLRDSVASDLN